MKTIVYSKNLVLGVILQDVSYVTRMAVLNIVITNAEVVMQSLELVLDVLPEKEILKIIVNAKLVITKVLI